MCIAQLITTHGLCKNGILTARTHCNEIQLQIPIPIDTTQVTYLGLCIPCKEYVSTKTPLSPNVIDWTLLTWYYTMSSTDVKFNELNSGKSTSYLLFILYYSCLTSQNSSANNYN